MARIRTIKPEFWTDAALIECSLNARLLFIGTWNFADDEGNLDRSAKQIKARIFPADAIDCEPLIQELIVHGLLNEYSVNGKKYLNIQGFKKHQVINRPGKPQCPLYEESVKIHGTFTEPSLPEGNGREGKGKESTSPASRPTPARKKKFPMPSDFGLSPGVRLWAAGKGFDRLEEHLDAFKRKATMNGYAYADWDMALQEAIREDWAKLRGNARGAAPAPAPVSDGSITCEACGTRTRSFTGRKCDPCWRRYQVAA